MVVWELRKKREKFEAEALPHLDTVFRAALALTGGGREAEDLAQQTFLRAWEKFAGFTPGSNCKAWLLSILRHLWIDEARHRKVIGPVLSLMDELSEAPRGEDPAVSGEILENFSDEQVIQALKMLPPEWRLILYLVDIAQIDHAEAARIAEIPVGTVKSRASRARNRLKEQLLAHARDFGFIKRKP